LANRASSAEAVSKGAAFAFGEQRANSVDHRLLPRTDLAAMNAVAANSATVLSSRTAASATFALKSAMLFATMRHP
jgi:hypothetical protein